MSQNVITVHSDKIEITTQNNETIYYNDNTTTYDTFNVITVAKVGSQNFETIIMPLYKKKPFSYWRR